MHPHKVCQTSRSILRAAVCLLRRATRVLPAPKCQLVCICVFLSSCAARRRRKAELQEDIEAALRAIVAAVNVKKDHIPPVVSAATLTFPFDVSISGYDPSRQPCAPKPGAVDVSLLVNRGMQLYENFVWYGRMQCPA
jgi:hypothetical protein